MAQGIDVRQTSGRLQFRALLLDTDGAVVTTGTTNLRLYELQDGGTLFSYDWNDNTFKSGALTTENQAMTHRQGNNNTTNTGVWTFDETDVGDFVAGSIYFIWITNSNASPPVQVREFQFGNAEGDMTVTAARLNVNIEAINTDTTAADNLDAALAVAAGAAGGLPLTNVDNRVDADAVAISASTDTADRLQLSLTVGGGGIDLNLAQALDSTPTADTTGDSLWNAANSLPNGDLPGSSVGLARVSDLIAASAGVNLRLVSTVMQASSTTTALIANSSDLPSADTNDIYNDLLVVARDVSAGNKPNVRFVSDYDASTNTFTLSSALDFTPQTGTDTFEVWAHTRVENVSSDLAKLTTGFSAANPDNLNSYLKALLSKAATVPSGVGTFSPTTDSVEALRELLDLMAGSGFSTGTDSLQAIRDAIDTLVAPAVVVSTSLSGSGFISDTVGCVRRAVDEPSTNPKYTNADILEFVAGAYDVALTDINVNSDHPILVRADLSIAPGQLTYNLPPHVSQIYRVAKVNATTHLPEYEVWPGSEFSFTGRGWTVEGNTIRLLADWGTTETLQILFIPNSETFMHKGTIASASVAADVTSTTIKFASSVTDGTLDTRPNCYAGYLIRIISSSTGFVEERLCTAYDRVTRIATINEAWGSTPAAGTDVVYEVVPQFSRLIRHVVCLRAAMDLLAQEGNQKRMQTLGVSYAVKLTALRRYLQSKQSRFPHSMNGDTIDNSNRGWYGGELY